MDDSIGYIIVMIILLVMSAFFSATETSFSTFNRIRVKNLAQNGSKRANAVMKLDEKYDKLLNTVLIGNNIVNIALSSIATLFFVGLLKNMDPESAQSIGATLSTVVITVVVLIFGEISPKVIAKNNADKVALAFAPIIRGIMIILTPFSFIFGGWSALMKKLFKSKDPDAYTEEELITIVDEAEEDGAIEAEEGDLIRSAIEFTDVSAGDILTPRVEICAISKDEKIEEIAKIFIEHAYSRLPVYDGDLDNIVGMLQRNPSHAKYRQYHRGLHHKQANGNIRFP